MTPWIVPPANQCRRCHLLIHRGKIYCEPCEAFLDRQDSLEGREPRKEEA